MQVPHCIVVVVPSIAEITNDLYIVGAGQNVLADIRKKQGFADRLLAMHLQFKHYMKTQGQEPEKIWYKRFWYVLITFLIIIINFIQADR